MTVFPVGPTGMCHESSAEIDRAAEWLAMQNPVPSPVVPEIRRRFALSLVEACQAIREAEAIRGRAT